MAGILLCTFIKKIYVSHWPKGAYETALEVYGVEVLNTTFKSLAISIRATTMFMKGQQMRIVCVTDHCRNYHSICISG